MRFTTNIPVAAWGGNTTTGVTYFGARASDVQLAIDNFVNTEDDDLGLYEDVTLEDLKVSNMRRDNMGLGTILY